MRTQTLRPILLLLLLLLGAYAAMQAGGPNGAVNTVSRKYPATAFPLGYRVDLGALGNFSNATGITIVTHAFTQWDNVVSAALSFVHSGSLARDVTSATDAYISGATQYSDGINPIIFDTDGSITDARFGVGAKNNVLGFAGSAYVGVDYLEGNAIINGFLSGSGNTSDQDRYKATITHEIGHFLGLAHSQVTMHADYVTMYPIIESNSQRFLLPDDTAAICALYPGTGFLISVGKISGTVKRPNNANLSGVNVIAVDSATGAAYSTLVDYFSGGRSGFDAAPTASGSYTISGLPPGKYYLRIESLLPNFTGGSSVASYDPPVNTGIVSEWYNGALENGDMLSDNINQKRAVQVPAGGTINNIDFVSNESSTLTSLTYHNGNESTVLTIPQSTAARYATRFTAPSLGSLVAIKVKLRDNSVLPLTGTMTFTVHADAPGGIAGIPGTALGSVTIPYSDLAANINNDIWLRGIGPAINFNSGAHFHVSIQTNGVGQPRILADNGNPTSNRSSFYANSTGTWRNFGQGAFTTPHNLLLTAVYSSTIVGNPAPAIALTPSPVNFGRKRPGQTVDKTVTLSNTGTDTLRVTSTVISGADAPSFTIVSGGGAFNLVPGDARILTLRFAPQDAGGAKSAVLTVTSNATTSPTAIALSGVGAEPNVVTAMSTLDFGSVRTGQTRTVDTIVLRNTGNDTLRISTIEMNGADGGTGFKLIGGSGSRIVAPDSVLKLRVRFVPTQRREYSGSIAILHDDSPSVTEILLTGRGAVPELTIIDTIDVGDVRTGAPGKLDTIFLHNSGDAPLSINGIVLAGADASRFELVSPAGLPVVVGPGDSVPVIIRFTADVRRRYRAILQVESDAAGGTVSVIAIGRGIGPLLDIPTPFSCGAARVGVMLTSRIPLANTGELEFTVTGLSVAGPNASEFIVESPAGLPVTVAPGDTLWVGIRFQPGGIGERTASLVVTTDFEPLQTETGLIGLGLEGALGVSSTSIDFGDVLVDATAERTIALSNTGSEPIEISGLNLSGASFTIMEPSLPQTIAPGGSLTLRVRFTPGGNVGAFNGSIVVTTAAPDNSSVTISLAGNGMTEASSSVEHNGIVAGGLSLQLLPVLPNPAFESAEVAYRVSGNGGTPLWLSLMNTRGEHVATLFHGRVEGTGASREVRARVDLREIPSGEYFVVMNGGGKVSAIRFVVVK